MAAKPSPASCPESLADLEAAVDQVIADCEGSARAAVRVLVVANAHLEAELETQRAEFLFLAQAVARDGESRHRYRGLERSEHPIPYTPGT